MLLLLFEIFFKIIPPKSNEDHQKSLRNFFGIDYSKEDYCKPQNGASLEHINDNYYNAYYYCEDNTNQFVFKKCNFFNITLDSTRYAYLIFSYKSDISIEESNFTKLQVYGRVISCEGDNYKFIFNANLLSNIKFSSGYSISYTQIVYSEFKKNEINNNLITYDYSIDKNDRGIGFHFIYHTGCIFQGNTIVGCYSKNDAGGLTFEKVDTESQSLQLSNCIFTKCDGKDPSILKMPEFNADITITNVTFEQTQVEDTKYLIHIFAYTGDQYHLTFDNCVFSNLKSNSDGCGGIGLMFKYYSAPIYGTSNHILEFKETCFEHIVNSKSGGAISIDDESYNQRTKVIVTNCNFDNVSSLNGNGGAIYYSPSQSESLFTISITGSTFKETHSNKGNGQAIFIGETHSVTVPISHCTFIDCCCDQNNEYSVYISYGSFSFSYNNITFTDRNKNHGCIFTKPNEYKFTHEYIGNTFINGNTEGDYSAGIDDKNPNLDIFVTIRNNTFIGFAGSSKGRCFSISSLNHNNFEMQNNTIRDCLPGGLLFLISFTTNNVLNYTIDSFIFINNKVDKSLIDECQSTPQLMVLECPQKSSSSNNQNNGFYDDFTLVFDNCLFENNYAPLKGGAINYGYSRFTACTKLKFSSCQFNSNYANEGGGALSIITYPGCIIDNCKFVNNKSDQGSSSIYIETDFSCKNSDLSGFLEIPTNRNPDVQITNCLFDGNDEGSSSSCIFVENSKNAPITIEGNNFTDCWTSGSVIDISSEENTMTFNKNKVEFTSLKGCGGISINGLGKIAISEVQFIQTSTKSALSINSADSVNPILIHDCTFDSCLATGYSCYSLSINTDSFSFERNSIQKISAKGCDNYVGLIECGDKITTLTFNKINFFDNKGSSLYGGGTSLMFRGISSLIFQECNFTNNCAIQDQSKSRLHQDTYDSYYNGDGGAIQIGHLCEINNIIVKFKGCEFNKNKAQRHGGAIAVQTLNNVEIEGCKFNENVANYNFQSTSNLLFDDHFYKKVDGRGGAVYINPTYNHQCECQYDHMPEILLKDCTLKSNNAYDGYAIYIDGEESGTELKFQLNNFIDNYNQSNQHTENPNLIFGAVITTEIFSITNESLKNNLNSFSYTEEELQVNPLSYVDYYGHTPSNEFTESNLFPSVQFSFSHMFSESFVFSNSDQFSNSKNFAESEYFTKSNEFSSSISFSGQITESQSLTDKPNGAITDTPNSVITDTPSAEIVDTPTNVISDEPTSVITNTPSVEITDTPNNVITDTPSTEIIDTPNKVISDEPTSVITDTPSIEITDTPTNVITDTPRVDTTDTPTNVIKDTPNSAVIGASSTIVNNNEQIQTESFMEKDGTGNSNLQKSNKNAKLSLIIGLVVAAVVLLIIILLITIFIIRKKKHSNTSENIIAEMTVEETNIDGANNMDEFSNPLCNDRSENDPFDLAEDEIT